MSSDLGTTSRQDLLPSFQLPRSSYLHPDQRQSKEIQAVRQGPALPTTISIGGQGATSRVGKGMRRITLLSICVGAEISKGDSDRRRGDRQRDWLDGTHNQGCTEAIASKQCSWGSWWHVHTRAVAFVRVTPWGPPIQPHIRVQQIQAACLFPVSCTESSPIVFVE